jgi:oligopeptidase B
MKNFSRLFKKKNVTESPFLRLFETPFAQPKEISKRTHGITRIDSFDYLQSNSALTKDYLNQEKANTNNFILKNHDLIVTLQKEMRHYYPRYELNNPPIKTERYTYSSRFDQQIKFYRVNNGTNKEEIILDTRWVTLKGHKVSKVLVSPDESLIAYMVSKDNTEDGDLYIKGINEKSEPSLYKQPKRIENIYNFCWLGSKIIYTILENLHSSKVFVVGLNDLNSPKLIFEEKDVEFFVDITTTKDKSLVLINTSSQNTSEIHLLSEQMEIEPLLSRSKHIKYKADKSENEYIYITLLTSESHSLLRIKSTNSRKTDISSYETIYSLAPTSVILDLEILPSHICLNVLQNTLPEIHIIDNNNNVQIIPSPEKISTIEFQKTNEPKLNFTYSSPFTIKAHCEINLPSVKVNIMDISNPDIGNLRYRSRMEYLHKDGVGVPFSLLYKGDLEIHQPRPCLIIAYGSYGIIFEPFFRMHYLSLLKRGFMIVLVHPRGGGEYPNWHLSGIKLDKQNSVDDLKDVCEVLIKKGYTDSKMMVGEGTSAGGFLFGCLLNQNPGLFSGVVLKNGFLDILNTMLSKDLPLSKSEIGEWGDPCRSKEDFENLSRLSPYESLGKMGARIFVSAGKEDKRVPYWQQLKYMAKWRHLHRDLNTAESIFHILNRGVQVAFILKSVENKD